MRENSLSPRKVFFATYTPNGSPLGGRRREKWIEPYSRPAGRELCEGFLTVCQEAARGRLGFLIRKNYPFRQKMLLILIALPLGDSNQKLNAKTPLLY